MRSARRRRRSRSTRRGVDLDREPARDPEDALRALRRDATAVSGHPGSARSRLAARRELGRAGGLRRDGARGGGSFSVRSRPRTTAARAFAQLADRCASTLADRALGRRRRGVARRDRAGTPFAGRWGRRATAVRGLRRMAKRGRRRSPRSGIGWRCGLVADPALRSRSARGGAVHGPNRGVAGLRRGSPRPSQLRHRLSTPGQRSWSRRAGTPACTASLVQGRW